MAKAYPSGIAHHVFMLRISETAISLSSENQKRKCF